MRALWIFGTLHFLIGSLVLFLTLHPLRDALDAHALDLVIVISAYQAVQGLAVMALAGSDGLKRLAAMLMAVGAALSAAMIYIIAFTGTHPFDLAVPAGGFISLLGWAALLFARPKTA
jgi:uncharacterized membrane protein YgdD (TMEM256/DUF423 family)